ncbi:MAG: nicotinate-nucleotide--dimethylbenzimidazole phosphoribosyltransferase [Oscillospiraceae bacterium]|nr:nicotinate-nucleotide--dimethylbenzimidazole phosphoribosyltransferase [Oscillospiraceae bacterium]
MSLTEQIKKILPPDEAAMQEARDRWNGIAKPIGSLGLLEDAVTQIAGLTGSAKVQLGKRAVLVMCADNGVVAEGVTQTGQEVTALVAGNMVKHDSSVCRMAQVVHAEVYPIDMGMIAPAEGVRDEHILRGTGNIALGPAMTREEAARAVEKGIDLVGELKTQGYSIIATGEMGIGNTTTASAMLAAFLEMEPALVTGRGAGLSDEGLRRKVNAIERALKVNCPDPADGLDVLGKVGGLDIAGMCGTFLGGAIHRVPILVDGFISAVAALCALRIAPGSRQAMLAAHVSAEPAARMVLEALDLKPLISAGLRLGEGTGAVAALPLLDMALAVYDGMVTFDNIGMEAYEVNLK